jgi:hypothetical protein
MQSVTLSLFRFGSVSARLWAFSQMATARFALKQVRELQTFKLCGSGTGEGFTPIPNTAVYAILATWPDHDAARRAMLGTSVFRAYRDHADEAMTIFLTPPARAGKWAGTEPFDTAGRHARRSHRRDHAGHRETLRRAEILGAGTRCLPRHRRGPQRHVQDRHRRSALDAAGDLLHLARRADHGGVRPRMTGRMPAPSRPSETAAGSAKNYTPASASTRWKGEWEGVTPDLTHRPERHDDKIRSR